MANLSPRGERPALGVTPQHHIEITYPEPDQEEAGQPITWLAMVIDGPLAATDTTVQAWQSTYVMFDLARPGWVHISDQLIYPSELVPGDLRLEPSGVPDESSTPYMAEDGSSITIRENSYSLGDKGAAQLIAFLQTVRPAPSEQAFSALLEDALPRMAPGLKEACYRYLVLNKDLREDPEVAFMPTEYSWSHLPFGGSYPEGLTVESATEFTIYAPPTIDLSKEYGLPVDTSGLDEAGPEQVWTKATWYKPDLPDDFTIDNAQPSGIEAVTLADVVPDLPEEVRLPVAKWLQNQLTLRYRWAAGSIRLVAATAGLDEAGFNQQKAAAQEDGQAFIWAKFDTWQDVLRHVLERRSYEESIVHWEKLDEAYQRLYGDYVKLFANQAAAEPASPSTWPDGMTKETFLAQLSGLHEQLQHHA